MVWLQEASRKNPFNRRDPVNPVLYICDFRLMCRIEHKESGRALECHSNQPGVQLYTGNFVPTDDSLKGKNGYFYKKHGGFCLETQTFPDAINQKFDHDSIIRPGQLYDHQVMYKLFF